MGLRKILSTVADPREEPVLDFANCVEIVVHEHMSRQEPIKIRLYKFTLLDLQKLIEEYIDDIHGTPYKIKRAAINNDRTRTPLVDDKEVEEFTIREYELYIYRASDGAHSVQMTSSVEPRPPRKTESVYIVENSPILALQPSSLEELLKPVVFTKDMDTYASQFVEGTRRWTLNLVWEWAYDPEESQVMWLYGGSGTGKSLISYAVIKGLPPREFVLGSYFFCRHNDTQKSDPISIVKSIVWDLVQNIGSLLPEFKKHVLKQLDDDQYQVKYYNKPSILSDPFKAFQLLIVDGLKKDALRLDKTILIVIDALDECNYKSRHSLLKVLTDLSPLLPSFIKIFVTARPEKDIYDCLTSLSVFELEPSRQDNLNDIQIVVEKRLRKMWNIVDENLSDEVAACVSNLVAKSEGLFIYVRAVCEFLEQNTFNPAAAKEQIDGFKSGPDDVYTLIAKKASEVIGAKVFESILGCILFANEPLDVATLSFMASLPNEQTQVIVDQVCIFVALFPNLKISLVAIYSQNQRRKSVYYPQKYQGLLFDANTCQSVLHPSGDRQHSAGSWVPCSRFVDSWNSVEQASS
ncbi:UNVERIFIED_CONTAM: hypothetical protein HDU68_008456 [Siphonaria sp. JEL0065]|nr:hypothetical protein HDU68_008456 [Siphonaria sp. JEL0065]